MEGQVSDEDVDSFLQEVGQAIQAEDPMLVQLAEAVLQDQLGGESHQQQVAQEWTFDQRIPFEAYTQNFPYENEVLPQAPLEALQENYNLPPELNDVIKSTAPDSSPPLSSYSSSSSSGSDGSCSQNDKTNITKAILSPSPSTSTSSPPPSSSSTCNGTSESDAKTDKVCSVCSAALTKVWNHYGAVVCNSCRAFFSRAIKKNAHARFVCANGDDACRVESKSWRSCQKCRFAKCLKAGMDLTRAKMAAKSRECGKKDEKTYDPVMAELTMELESKLTLGELKMIDQIRKDYQHGLVFQMGKFFARDLETFAVFLSMNFDKDVKLPPHLNYEINNYMLYTVQSDPAASR